MGKIMFVKPDLMKLFIKITEKKLKSPFLYLRGVVYDKLVRKVVRTLVSGLKEVCTQDE